MTGPHLTLFILNAIIPLLWIPLIIKHIVSYYQLRNEVAEGEIHLENLEDAMSKIPDDAPANVKEEIKIVKMRIDVGRQNNKHALKFCFHHTIFWVIIGVLMTLCAILDTIEIGVKLYHKECPCQMAVEAAKKALTNSVPETVSVKAKEGPSFSVTLQNVKFEEEAKDEQSR